MAYRSDTAAALAAAARDINQYRDLHSTLDAIVNTAQESLPGIEHIGISIAHRDGKIETKAATDQFVWELDQQQYELGEGPCIHAIKAERVVIVEHARREQRWPQFIPWAVERGLRSQLGLRLYVNDETLGGLNLYSTSSDTINQATRQVAELFASHAALALGHAIAEDNLNEALGTRKVIGVAIGLIMHRYGLDEDRAFQYLARTSQNSNIKLRDIAAEVVTQANELAIHRAEGN